jgi:hypothetical protein
MVSPRPVPLKLHKFLENGLLLVGRDAHPGIMHPNIQKSFTFGRTDGYRARFGEFDGVTHQVIQNLLQAVFVAHHQGKIFRDLIDQLQLFAND